MTELIDMLRPYLPLISLTAVVFAVLILFLLWLMISKASAKKDDRPAPAEPAAPKTSEAEQAAGLAMAPAPEVPPSDLQEASDASAGSLRRSFNKAVKIVKRVVPGRDPVYRMPWYLLLGEGHSGKTTLLNSLKAPMPLGKPISGQPTGATPRLVNWWFFERALVLDLAGDILMKKTPPGQPPSALDGPWRSILSNLQRVRPHRPIDGVVLTLSAADLLAQGSAEAVSAKANHLAARLADMQRQFGLAFPVHVVVTQCDRVPMFQPFFASLDPVRQDQMFGWSNPHNLDAAYEPSWVDQAFATLNEGLTAAVLEVAALGAEPQEAEAALLFPGAFNALKAPLSGYLDRLFRPSAYAGGVHLRGIHFVGDAGKGDTRPTAAPKAAIAAAAPALETKSTAHAPDSLQALFARSKGEVADDDDIMAAAPAIELDGATETVPEAAPAATPPLSSQTGPCPILANDLFSKRIFRETGLAKPLSGRLVNRNRAVVTAQAIAAGLAVVLLGGLAISYFGVKSDVASLEPALRDVERDIVRLDNAPQATNEDDPARQAFYRQYKQNSARKLLDAMAQIQTNTLGGLFLPSSWFSSLDDRVVQFISLGFDRIIMRAMYDQLEVRAENLLATDRRRASAARDVADNPAARGDIEAAPEYLELAKLVNGLEEFESNVERYNGLGRDADLAVLGQLTQYLFDISLPEDFFSYGEFYTRAIENARQRPFDITQHSGRAVARIRDVTWTLYERLFHSGQLSQTLYDLTLKLRSLEQPAPSLEAEAQGLRDVLAMLKATDVLLASPEWTWLDGDRFNVSLGFGQLMARAGALNVLGPQVSIELITQGQNAFEQFKRSLGAYRTDLTGPVLARDGDRVDLALSPALSGLAGAIEGAFRQPFMAVRIREGIDPQNTALKRASWDGPRLDAAVQLYEGYDQFRSGTLQAFPSALQSRVNALALERLDANLSTAIARAQTSVETGGWLSAPEDGLTREITDFRAASPRLLSLLTVMDDLGLGETYQDLQGLTLAQATDMLNRADGLLDAEGLYRPYSPLASWSGAEPAVFHAFNVGDDTEVVAYLDAMRDRVAYLLREYVEPLIGFLSESPFRSAVSGARVTTKWRRIFETVARYNKHQPGTTMGELEKFVRFDMGETTGDNCAERIAEPRLSRTSDFFLARKQDLHQAVYDRCKAMAAGRLANRYVELADLFNRLLSGRYPFQKAAPGEPLRDAAADDIRTFFTFFDREEKAIRSLLGGTLNLGPEAGSALHFMDQLAAARAFFLPLMTVQPGKPILYPYTVAFRSNEANEQGGNQIIDWSVAIASKGIDRRDNEKAGLWRPGDPVSVSLRWAKDSPRKPASTANGSGKIVEGLTVQWRYDGDWSLLRLLELHATDPGDFVDGRDPDPHTLKFVVNNSAPETWINPDLQPESSGPKSQTRVYLHLGLTATEAEGAAPLTLVMPLFPVRAPALTAALN